MISFWVENIVNGSVSLYIHLICRSTIASFFGQLFTNELFSSNCQNSHHKGNLITPVIIQGYDCVHGLSESQHFALMYGLAQISHHVS